MAEIKIPDHTSLVDFCLRNRDALRVEDATTKAQVLEGAAEKANKKEFAKLLSSVAKSTFALDEDLRHSSIKEKAWVEGLPVLARVEAFRGSAQSMQALLLKEAHRASEPLGVALRVAADILEDGAGTIYNPEYWIVKLVVDPRGYLGAVGQGLKDLQKAAEDLVSADVAGAIVGGVIGGIKGGPTPKGAAAGAAKGAAEGAASASGTAALS
jgi:hypothetical protein